MKLNPKSTQQQISNQQIWEHPWNTHMKKWNAEQHWEDKLKKPNQPTTQAIEKAKFKDKTFTCNGR